MSQDHKFEIRPLSPKNWDDFEILFGPRGACAGCWCMYWFKTQKEFDLLKGEGLKSLMYQKVWDEGKSPGLIIFVDGEAAGWIAVGPREQYSRLARSRILKPIDDLEVWSIVCFFVNKKWRKQGLNSRLITTAVNHARDNGAKIIEAYPEDPDKPQIPDVFAYTGFVSSFRKAGFIEVARRSATRPIMRLYLD